MENLLKAFKEEDINSSLDLVDWLYEEGKTLEDIEFMVRNKFNLRTWGTLGTLINWMAQNDKDIDDVQEYFRDHRRIYRLRDALNDLTKRALHCPDCDTLMKIQVWKDQDNCGQWTCGSCRRGVYFENYDDELRRLGMGELHTIRQAYREALNEVRAF